MYLREILFGLAAATAFSVSAVQAQSTENNCNNNDLQNQTELDDECLALPPVQEATNLIVGLGPAAVAGAGALAALAGTDGSTTSTTSTSD